MKRFLVAVTMLGACGDSRPVPQSDRAPTKEPYLVSTPAPQDSVIEGIPLRALDSSWASASALRHAIVVSDSGKSAFADSAVRQAFLEGDFNQDGHADRAVVGVYRTKADSVGRFVLIVTRKGEVWQKAALERMTGAASNTFLWRGNGDTLVWNDCLECDATPVYVYWSGKGYVIRWAE